MAFNWKSLLAGAVGGGAASQFSALRPFQAAISAGAGALADKKNRLSGAVQGAIGGAGGASLASGVRGAMNGNPMSSFGSNAMSGLKSFGGSVPGFGGVGTANPTGALAKFFTPQSIQSKGIGGMPLSMGNGQNMTSQFGNLVGNPKRVQTPLVPGGYGLSSEHTPTGLKFTASPNTPNSNFAPTNSGSGGTSVKGAMNPMEMFKNMIPGAAVAGLGGILAPKVTPPDYGGVIDQFKNQVATGGNPVARDAAMKQFLSTVQAPEGANAEAGLANAQLIADRQKAEARRSIEQQFAANNGNTMGNSAYDEAVRKSDLGYDQNIAAQKAQLQFEYDNQQRVQKQAAATALAGMDDTQLQYYAGLAGLSIQQIQEKFQFDAGSAQSLKDIATQAGGLMMQKGLGL